MNTNPNFKQQTTGFSQEYLTNEIIMWGHNKGIIKFSTSDAQASKTLEEVEELRTHAAQLKFLREVVTPGIMRLNIHYPTINAVGDLLNKLEADLLSKLVDDYGDVFVTLVMGAEIEGIDIRSAIASAYDEIKDRRGEMRADGKFHKE